MVRKTILGIGGAVLLAGCGASETAPEPVPEPEQHEPQEETETAEPVELRDSDGLFTYTVDGISEQGTYVDTWETQIYPDNDEFLVVDLTAVNESDAPAYAPDPYMIVDHIVMIDSEGREHNADDEPMVQDNLEVNPAAATSYSVVWDLPEGVEAEYIELAAPEAPGLAVLEATE